MKILGLWITAVWTLLVVVYLTFAVKADKLPWKLEPNEFGDFFAGTAGPLALTWLVLAFFIQSAQLEAQSKSVTAQEEALKATQRAIELQRQSLDMQREELQLQRRELELQRQETARLADEASKQSESLRLAEYNARRDTFLRVYELTLPSLLSCAYRIGRSLEGSAIDAAATQHANGESEAVFDLCVNILRSRPRAFVDGSRVSADGHESAVRFLSKFEDLLSQAQEADPTGSIRKNLENSGLGSLYVAIAFVSNWDLKLQFRKRPSGVDQLRY